MRRSSLAFLLVFLTVSMISSMSICSKLSLSVCRVAIALGRRVRIF